MNQQEKRPVVVLTEEGDRWWRVCGVFARSVVHQRSEVDKRLRGVARRVVARFARAGAKGRHSGDWLPLNDVPTGKAGGTSPCATPHGRRWGGAPTRPADGGRPTMARPRPSQAAHGASKQGR
jgi:hypothetical protein